MLVDGGIITILTNAYPTISTKVIMKHTLVASGIRTFQFVNEYVYFINDL